MEVATYLLEFFLLLEVTAVQAAVLLLLTHRAADFHMEHVFQPSDNLEKAVSSFKVRQGKGVLKEAIGEGSSATSANCVWWCGWKCFILNYIT